MITIEGHKYLKSHTRTHAHTHTCTETQDTDAKRHEQRSHILDLLPNFAHLKTSQNTQNRKQSMMSIALATRDSIWQIPKLYLWYRESGTYKNIQWVKRGVVIDV